MLNRNADLKKLKGGVPNWAIAEKLGISEMTLYRWFRQELTPERKLQILEAINSIKKEIS